MANALFYLVAALSVVAAAGVVLFRNPISNVLSLLFAFFCLATIYLLAGFQFLAATQILVYAGAIMVLFLFVIMLLNLAPGPNAPELERVGLAMFLRRKSGITLVIAVALLLLGASAVLGTPETAVQAAQALPEKGIDAITRELVASDGSTLVARLAISPGLLFGAAKGRPEQTLGALTLETELCGPASLARLDALTRCELVRDVVTL